MSVFSRYALLASVFTFGVAPAAMAQSSGYFIPGGAQQSAPAAHSQSAPAAPAQQAADGQEQLPPVPNLPALPAEAAPPTAVIGVISVPDVLRQSTAAQGVQAIIEQRQAALAKDAQAARAKIQAEQQAIIAEQGKISNAALEAKEQALQQEVATTQTKFQLRNEAIQKSGQEALSKIEAELIAIVRQEAQAHGMNLVLHREQVALNVAAFDITNESATELNKLLPKVDVPPSVVTPDMEANPPAPGQDGGQ
ncbi:OmpH family outer membrane protein [Acidocella sp.]|uniref:OmpH family outer membrane protein n=1 Tax=Acidocella sp. TaxID=50710 RepID=UPI00261385DC|nr:OmpH family outer membrane protein [Acidocella sp.]